MQQCECLLDDPAVLAQSGAMLCAAAGDDRHDAPGRHLLTVFVVVVGPIGELGLRFASRTSATASHRREALDQRHQLGDVVTAAAGQRHLQWDSVPFGDEMVFRT